MKNEILQGNCLDELKELDDNSVDSIVTDPPYELGFMGKSWDTTGIANNVEMWKECLRVLKPGGYLLSFSGTRTYHRMAVAIENAGFEIRDMIEWVYGSGFPKSLNIGKAIDKLLGNEREVIEKNPNDREKRENQLSGYGLQGGVGKAEITKGNTEWEGWGTALKPSHEPVVFCSKPLTPRLYFAILIGDISNNIIQLCQISNVKDAEKIFSGIQAKLEKEGVLSVADNVRINAWESLENVKFAEKSFTSKEQKSSDLTKTKENSAQLNAKQNGKKDNLQEIKTLAGVEANIKALMDIIIFGTTENTSQNIALLWNNISEELLNQANTLTIKMATRLITDLKILKLSATQSILESTGSLFKTPQNIPPNHEPICMARKPLSEKTVAENVLRWGTGGINIDESRVESSEKLARPFNVANNQTFGKYEKFGNPVEPQGRFPANLILSADEDGQVSEEVRECFPETKGDSPNRKERKGGHRDIFVGTENNNVRNQIISDVKFTDSGNASRYFKSIPHSGEDFKSLIYQAKASKNERNKGLDKLVLVDIMEVCKEKNTTSSVKLAQLLVGMEQSLPRVTVVSGTQNKSVIEWSTGWFGKDLMEKYQEVCKSTILTETHSITTLQTFNWLLHLLTNEYTADVSLEMATGGNLVGNAENYSELTITISEKMALALGVKNVPSPTQLKISVKEGRSGHPTVKPIALMEYLIKMVTPKGGIVLDPFAGSGSTLVAAKQNGFQYIGIEMEEEYITIAKARLSAVSNKLGI